MSSTKLVRASGFALILAGILIALALPVHPSDADPLALSRPAWVPVHTTLLTGATLSLFGLIGLYNRLRGKSGWLSLTSFVSLFIGSVLVTAILFVEAFVFPAIASTAAGRVLLDPTGPLFAGPLALGRNPAARRDTPGLLAAATATAWHHRRRDIRSRLCLGRLCLPGQNERASG